ncbi:MAG: ECF RNA polymerase sigma factor SigE [Firmicutes bacterium ADurb.Bin419]|nr:MAG: ECF RNA polymerase sigma factor SigE [Firmicutes bacterium ADurb.Bin419]
MSISDENLIKAVRHGDQNALEQLVRRWYPRIYAYILRMIGKETDAYDVTQETFLSMVKAIENYKLWGKFQSWIFTIAHNKCMDFFRMHGVVNTSIEHLDEEKAHEKTYDEIGIEAMIINTLAVENALKRLSVMQRDAIVLYYFNGFNLWQIAQMTNTPLTTIKSRMSAAKKLLANYLKEELG